jgi:hypothetical protein
MGKTLSDLILDLKCHLDTFRRVLNCKQNVNDVGSYNKEGIL